MYTLARSIEAKDPYTEGHCDRLSRYTVSLAEKIGLSREVCNDLRRSEINVHDIGKVAVPENVLLKLGPLDAAENRRIMERHTIGRRAHLRLPTDPSATFSPVRSARAPREAGWQSGYPDHPGRRNPAHCAHPANRRHLRFAHSPIRPIAECAHAGKGARNYARRKRAAAGGTLT